MIENVGNLVCPSLFDLGETKRVVIISTTEGEDKPLKYPLMFRVCDCALINKTDLLPYLEFDIEEAKKNILQVNPNIKLFEISAAKETGLEPWVEWIKEQVAKKNN